MTHCQHRNAGLATLIVRDSAHELNLSVAAVSTRISTDEYFAERLDDADAVGNPFDDPVILDLGRLGQAAVGANVHRYRAVTGPVASACQEHRGSGMPQRNKTSGAEPRSPTQCAGRWYAGFGKLPIALDHSKNLDLCVDAFGCGSLERQRCRDVPLLLATTGGVHPAC